MAVGNPKSKNVSEQIDARILRLLGLEDVFDLDYDTYLTLLKEVMVKGRMPKTKMATEEVELITNEFKRVKGKSGRFSVKTKKVNVKAKTGPIKVTNNKYILNQKNIISPQKLLPGTSGTDQKVAETIKTTAGSSKLEENVSAIRKSVESIESILSNQLKFQKSLSEKNRKGAEGKKRGERESSLEKPLQAISKAVSSLLAPVKSIWDTILNFLIKTILGRILFKLLDWMGDASNQNKIKSVIRFFSHWGPTLLSLYIVFGTSLGKFARGLISLVIKSAIKLAAVTASLAVKAGIGGKGGFLSKAAGFLGGRKGKLLAAGLETAVVAGGTLALSNTLKGGGNNQQQTQGFSGGGRVRSRFPAFGGGGFNFKGMMGGAGMGAMFGPLGMLLGGAFGSGKPQQMVSGFVSGEKGIDKIPAMLSDGEFVMSAGAVKKIGLDTLEAMNASGGGTNKPRILGGTAYAAGGGLIGSEYYNTTLSKDPLTAVKRFIAWKFGADIDKKSTWGLPAPKMSGSPSMLSGGGTSTGSLLTNPMGAMARISSQLGLPTSSPGTGIKMPGLPSGVKMPGLPSGVKMPGLPSGIKLPKLPSGSGGLPGPVKEVLDKLKGPGAATYADAGSIYAKQMLGGFGGPVSERDLSKESQAELQKAIQRAKKRTGSEISKAEAKIKELRAQGAKDGNPALETQKSFLKKLKAGGIRVQYTDYADEKGNMSESAKNAKNILGQFWANERSKEEGGGYRIEDKYDFDMFKKKDEKTGKMRDMTGGELWNEGFLGKGKTTQQRLQALYLLNPFKGKGDVDMVLGGKRTAAESWGLSASKTLLGGMLGASGKPKDKNTQALEAKRPWWDKMGWFGGGSKVAQEQAKAKQQSKANVQRSKPKTSAPPPPPKPKTTVVSAPKNKNKRGGGTTTSNTKPPAVTANNNKRQSNAKSSYGIKK